VLASSVKEGPVSLQALFGELPLDLVIAGGDGGRGAVIFRRAAEALAHHNLGKACLAFEEITATNGLSSRDQIQAWGFLKQLGYLPTSQQEKQILGVVVEVGMRSGQDVLAVYADRTAHYYNFSGAGVVWGRPDSSLDISTDGAGPLTLGT
jgi:hypothetical protein